jgi:hypothetical protein
MITEDERLLATPLRTSLEIAERRKAQSGVYHDTERPFHRV